MAALVEASKWENDIYQLETSDPVQGGPDGIDNLQARQLANRTRYLKDSVDGAKNSLVAHTSAADPHPQYATKADLASRLADLVGQAPTTLDTLSEIAAALGKDPNFSTTMMNALGLKAPIDSPDFTGIPKVPTQAAGDNSKAAASTAHVKSVLSAGFASSGKIGAVNSANLLFNGSGEFGDAGWASSNFGAIQGNIGEGTIFVNGTAINSSTYVLDPSDPIPCAANVPVVLSAEITTGGLSAGKVYLKIEAFNASGNLLATVATTAPITDKRDYSFVTTSGVTPAGTAYLKVSKVADTAPVISQYGTAFRRIKLEKGVGFPSLYSQEASILALAGLFRLASGTNDYLKLPGLIIQWGQYNTSTSPVTVNFPIAFPNKVHAVLLTPLSTLAYGTADAVYGQPGLASFQVVGVQMTSNNVQSSHAGNFIAIGR